MAKKARKQTRVATAGRSAVLPILDEEEKILQKATIHLIMHHGGLLVATDLREQNEGGQRTWVITVTLRYPTGHEGYVGDLFYDGEEFTFLTPPEVLRERVRAVAADPERERKWNEYRASTQPPGEG
jgi:hypothetical protein